MANLGEASTIRNLRLRGETFITVGELLDRLGREELTKTLRMMLLAAGWRFRLAKRSGERDGYYHDEYRRDVE